jgi:hypothetical protein
MGLAQDILANSLPSSPPILEGVVGDTVNLQPQQTFAAATVTITRKPSSSSATVSTTSVTFDVSGSFVLTIACGGFSRIFSFLVFPASVLTAKAQPQNPNSALVNRGHLRALANDARVTSATLALSLEATPSTLIGLVGGSRGPAWNEFA